MLSSGNLELISVFRDLQSILQITWKYILTVLEEKDYMSVYLEIVFNPKIKKELISESQIKAFIIIPLHFLLCIFTLQIEPLS